MDRPICPPISPSPSQRRPGPCQTFQPPPLPSPSQAPSQQGPNVSVPSPGLDIGLERFQQPHSSHLSERYYQQRLEDQYFPQRNVQLQFSARNHNNIESYHEYQAHRASLDELNTGIDSSSNYSNTSSYQPNTGVHSFRNYGNTSTSVDQLHTALKPTSRNNMTTSPHPDYFHTPSTVSAAFRNNTSNAPAIAFRNTTAQQRPVPPKPKFGTYSKNNTNGNDFQTQQDQYSNPIRGDFHDAFLATTLTLDHQDTRMYKSQPQPQTHAQSISYPQKIEPLHHSMSMTPTYGMDPRVPIRRNKNASYFSQNDTQPAVLSPSSSLLHELSASSFHSTHTNTNTSNINISNNVRAVNNGAAQMHQDLLPSKPRKLRNSNLKSKVTAISAAGVAHSAANTPFRSRRLLLRNCALILVLLIFALVLSSFGFMFYSLFYTPDRFRSHRIHDRLHDRHAAPLHSSFRSSSDSGIDNLREATTKSAHVAATAQAPTQLEELSTRERIRLIVEKEEQQQKEEEQHHKQQKEHRYQEQTSEQQYPYHSPQQDDTSTITSTSTGTGTGIGTETTQIESLTKVTTLTSDPTIPKIILANAIADESELDLAHQKSTRLDRGFLEMFTIFSGDNEDMLICRAYHVCRLSTGQVLLPNWMKIFANELKLCGLDKVRFVKDANELAADDKTRVENTDWINSKDIVYQESIPQVLAAAISNLAYAYNASQLENGKTYFYACRNHKKKICEKPLKRIKPAVIWTAKSPDKIVYDQIKDQLSQVINVPSRSIQVFHSSKVYHDYDKLCFDSVIYAKKVPHIMTKITNILNAKSSSHSVPPSRLSSSVPAEPALITTPRTSTNMIDQDRMLASIPSKFDPESFTPPQLEKLGKAILHLEHNLYTEAETIMHKLEASSSDTPSLTIEDTGKAKSTDPSTFSRHASTSHSDASRFEHSSKIFVFELNRQHRLLVCQIFDICRKNDGVYIAPQWMKQYENVLDSCGMPPVLFGQDHRDMAWDATGSMDLLSPIVPRDKDINFLKDFSPVLLVTEIFGTSATSERLPYENFYCYEKDKKECSIRGSQVNMSLHPAIFMDGRVQKSKMNIWPLHFISRFPPAPKGPQIIYVKESLDSGMCFGSVLSVSTVKHEAYRVLQPESPLYKFFGRTKLESKTSSCDINISILGESLGDDVSKTADLTQALVKALKYQVKSKYFSGFNISLHIESPDFESLEYEKQVSLMKSTTVLITWQHSAISSLFMLPVNSTVIGLFPFGYQPQQLHEVSWKFGLQYNQIISEPDEATFLSCLEEKKESGEVTPEQQEETINLWLELVKQYKRDTSTAESIRFDLVSKTPHHQRECARMQDVIVKPDVVAKLSLQEATKRCKRISPMDIPRGKA